MTEQDRLSITGIEFRAHHGVLEHERTNGQTFVLDLVLGLDTSGAAAADDLHQTVDYGTLVTQVVAAASAGPVDLIETVAQRVAETVLGDSRVSWVEVTLHKPHAPIEATFTDVAVTIIRRRS